MKRRTGFRVLPLLAALLVTGCSPRNLGFPRIALSVPSPDGHTLALVHNHPTLHPPRQSLWLLPGNRSAEEVLALAEGRERCAAAVWSADSSTVGFLVARGRFLLVDAATAKVVADRLLFEQGGAAPPPFRVEDLSLSQDGSAVSFRLCPRSGGDCMAPRTLHLRDAPTKPA